MMMQPGGRWSSYVEEQKRRGRKINRHVLKRLLSAFKPYKLQMALSIFAVIASSVLALVPTLLTPAIFDKAIPQRNLGLLSAIALLMIAATLVSGAMSVWQTYLNNKVGQSVMRDFRYKLYAHLQDMPFRFFTSMRVGEIQSRLTNDVNSAQSVATDTFSAILTNLTTVVAALVAMLLMNVYLTLIYLIALPFFLLLTYKAGEVRRRIGKRTLQSQASLSALLQETLSVSGVLLIKTFGRKQFALDQFARENQQVADLSLHQQLVGRWLMMLMNIFSSLIAPIMYILAGWMLVNHFSFFNITLGGLIAFVLLQSRFFAPLSTLVTLQINLQGALALFDRIFEYLDLNVELKDAPNAVELSPETVEGRITFKNVSFAYKLGESDLLKMAPENSDMTPLFASTKPAAGVNAKAAAVTSQRSSAARKLPVGVSAGSMLADTIQAQPPVPASSTTRPTLRDISFDILPGQLAALVGPSGAGKTTITYLIPRLYDVDSGAVEIGGYNVKDATLASLCSMISVVTQETYLFHSTVRDNLLYVRPEATEEEIIEATKAAAIHDTIMQLENGYDTIVGERGYRLSGGEKQRLAIARVLLKNPRILILDEATSSLDSHSERLIQRALKPLMQTRTTIAIAHRLSTILAADIILVVDKGEIVERGTHQQLLAYGGMYARLYKEQFSQQMTEEALPEIPQV